MDLQDVIQKLQELEQRCGNVQVEGLLLTRGGPAEWLWLHDITLNVLNDIEGETKFVVIQLEKRSTASARQAEEREEVP